MKQRTAVVSESAGRNNGWKVMVVDEKNEVHWILTRDVIPSCRPLRVGQRGWIRYLMISTGYLWKWIADERKEDIM